MDENYEKTAQVLLNGFRMWLQLGGPAPRFRLPPKDIALMASLDVIGHKLALDPIAHKIVDWACTIDFGGGPPTFLMLRAVLDMLGIETEQVSLSELGINIPQA
jgi:hypothetical protein